MATAISYTLNGKVVVYDTDDHARFDFEPIEAEKAADRMDELVEEDAPELEVWIRTVDDRVMEYSGTKDAMLDMARLLREAAEGARRRCSLN